MESDHADAVPPPGDQPPAEPPEAIPPSTDPPPADPAAADSAAADSAAADPAPADPAPADSPSVGSTSADSLRAGFGAAESPLAAGSPSTGDHAAPGVDPPPDDDSRVPDIRSVLAGDDPPAGREPHILLVHAVIKASREHDTWSASGGPRPQLPRTWTELWRNAVRRQTDLAGEPEEEARRTVQAMLDQLTRLDREAAWFRSDVTRRDRAISETLLYGTRLGPDVPSRPAQLAWDRQRGLRPVDYAKITAIAAAQDEWLAAWNEWATTD
ncbi:hypothetical protein [Actinoplanes sp. NPDC026670]|uniref:hypothetical protein n=1 Tax=Actinoplanes sp. NPDC026670 TaxID=3154700 RepID=UPI0033E48D44